MYAGPTGIQTIDWKMLCALHPRFALAVLCDRPPVVVGRSIQIAFTSNATQQAPIPKSFSSPMATYSIFAGCDIVVDPTGAFQPTQQAPAPNPLKSISDFFQGLVSGVTVQVQVDSKDAQKFSPISDYTPLELVPNALNRGAGVWKLDNPENVKVLAKLVGSPPSGNFTVWFLFSFLQVLAAGDILGMKNQEARACLKKMGYGGGDPFEIDGVPQPPAKPPY